MGENPWQLIALFGSAIGALFGALVKLYYDTLSRAYKRIDLLEGREHDVLIPLTRALEGVENALKSVMEFIKDQDRRGRRGGV